MPPPDRTFALHAVERCLPPAAAPMATGTIDPGTTSGPPAAGLPRYGSAWPEVIFYSVNRFPLESTTALFSLICFRKPRPTIGHTLRMRSGAPLVHCTARGSAATETTHQNYFTSEKIIILCLLLQPPLFSFIFLPVSFYSRALFFILRYFRANHRKVLKHFSAA